MAMTDQVFRNLLIHRVEVGRPRVELDFDGSPETPTFDTVAAALPCRLTPARNVSEDDLLGRAEEATHVLYAEPTDLRAGDRIRLRPVNTTLAEDAGAGETVLMVQTPDELNVGIEVEIGSGQSTEERTITNVGTEEIEVAPALDQDHQTGEPVSVVRQYHVLTVQDEAGAGHHVKAALRYGG
jgi:hypothetical protein